MKKYITSILLLISLSASAANTSTEVGRMTTYTGSSIVFYVSDRNGDKEIFILVSDKYRIRKNTMLLNKIKATQLKDLLDKALKSID